VFHGLKLLRLASGQLADDQRVTVQEPEDAAPIKGEGDRT